jgi:hypothetical protein
MQDTDWNKLLDDIEEQHAVLLLGHGFLPGAQAGLAGRLHDKLGDRLLHSHDREGLFLFRDIETKTDAQQEAARWYRSATQEEALMRKMVEMPFPLIVSGNPDKLLLDAFARYRLPCQFDYFSSQHKAAEYPTERPHRDKPLLYNLCGSHEDRESLLLDYDDLFQMLSGLLADLNVPNDLRMSLRKATTYVFVGFHFERWYTQLFLRYLNMNTSRFANNSRNYALKTSFRDPDSQAFFLQQFNVKYIGAGLEFFDELYRRFAARYPHSLRQVVDALSPTATAIVQLVERADFVAAFQMLKIFAGQLDHDDRDLLTLTESEYAQHARLQADGTSTQEHLSIMLARVRRNVMELAKKLE